MTLSPDQRTAFRRSVSARETPRALIVVCASFVAVTMVNYAFGQPMPVSTILMNGFVALALLGAALLTRDSRLPTRVIPWVAAVCAVVMIAAGQVQVWISPDGSAFAYILLIIVAYSPLTLAWAPAMAAAIPILAGCVIVSRQWPAAQATDWLIASTAAVTIGMVLLGLRLRSIDETGQLTAQVEALATKDQLTGVLNRHGVWQLVPGLRARARRAGKPVFALFVDVVGLKQSNDSFGHDAGDRIIVDVADALTTAVRGDDILGRWGGDEFLILGVGEPQEPAAFARRVRECLARRDGPDATRITDVSVGSAVIGGDQLDVDALIERADEDMYARRRTMRDLRG